MASTSSVYGVSAQTPFYETNVTDRPITLYAATKKSTELMGHSYAHLWRLPTTMFRFFTVYGPWGRPDMAPLKFLEAIEEGRAIDVYNHGDMLRDFTYIDDITQALVGLIDVLAEPTGDFDASHPDPSSSPTAPYRLYNIGNNQPESLEYFIEVLETCIGNKAVKNYLDLQPGDVVETYADISDLERHIGFRPSTSIEQGLAHFVNWYRAYHLTV